MRNCFFALIFTLLSTAEVFASSIIVKQKLYFGRLVPTSNSGHMQISTAGAVTSSSGVQNLSGLQTRGLFDYTASGLGILLNLLVAVDVTTPTVTLTSVRPGAGNVIVDNLVVSPTNALLTLNLGSAALSNISFGGKINFSQMPSGSYTGFVGVRVTSTLGLIAAANANIPVEVVFLNILAVNETSYLNFGNIDLTNTASGVVRMTPTAVRSIVSGSGITLASRGVPPTAGTFEITGEPNQAVSVSLPSSISMSSGSGGNIIVSNITSSPTGSFVLNASGSLILRVGGEVNLAAGQASGNYNGTYIVTVNY